MRLESRMAQRMSGELVFDNQIRRRKPSLHVAALERPESVDVRVGNNLVRSAVVDVHVGVDQRRVVLESLQGIEDRRQLFVFDPHEVHSLLGLCLGPRRDRDDRLADVANTVDGEERLVLDRRSEEVGVFLPGDDRLDAGGACSGFGVDGDDPGMRVLAAKDRSVEHARQLNVDPVDGGAGHLLTSVDSCDRLADMSGHRVLLPVRRSNAFMTLV